MTIERVTAGAADMTAARRLLTTDWRRTIRRETIELFRCRFVVQMVVTTQLALRYQRSVLGFAWTFVNPLLLLVVQTLIFGQLLRIDPRTYAVYLFSGLVAWQFFSSTLQSASQSLIGNEGLIRRVATPLMVFPITELAVALVNAAAALLALLAMLAVLGAPIHAQIVLLVPGTLLLVAFTAGLALLVMTINTLYRDFTQIVAVALFAGYFATPIIYPASAIHSSLLRYNPMTYYVEFFHDGLVSAAVLMQDPGRTGGVWPPIETWIVAALCAIVSLLVGYAAFKTNEHEFIFRL